MKLNPEAKRKLNPKQEKLIQFTIINSKTNNPRQHISVLSRVSWWRRHVNNISLIFNYPFLVKTSFTYDTVHYL